MASERHNAPCRNPVGVVFFGKMGKHPRSTGKERIRMKKAVAMILVICALCLCFVGCGTAAEPQAYKYVIYCGLADADAGEQVLTQEEAAEAARQVIIDHGCGYTEYTAYGAAADSAAGNDTLVYELIFTDEAVAKEIATAIKAELNLASVLFEAVPSTASFAE